VTKAKYPEKGGGKMAGSKGKKSGDIICFVCRLVGHYVRDCEKRKGAVKALVTTAAHEDEKEENCDEWDVALFTSNECVLFTGYEILLDNEASINIFRDKNLLTGVRDAGRKVVLGGIQRSASGVKVTQEGEFSDVGTVYFSDLASANILSFASQIDAGADISYDKRADTFVMTPAGGRNTYLFGRKQANGIEGRLYTCDIRTMIVPREQAFCADSGRQHEIIHQARRSAGEKSQGEAGQDGISLGGTGQSGRPTVGVTST
jgi:hypothetical protein